MRIYTTNKAGQKVAVDYTETIIEEKEEKPDISIGDDDYTTFKKCVLECREQKQYVGGGDKRYERALSDLLRRDHDLYNRYYAKLQEEYRNSR